MTATTQQHGKLVFRVIGTRPIWHDGTEKVTGVKYANHTIFAKEHVLRHFQLTSMWWIKLIDTSVAEAYPGFGPSKHCRHGPSCREYHPRDG